MSSLDDEIAAAVINNNVAAAILLGEEEAFGIDHRTLSRKKKKEFDHQGALECLQRDYLGPQPLFNDRQFDVMFRISRSRFQRLMDDVATTGNPF
jgi:hypothetical protein